MVRWGGRSGVGEQNIGLRAPAYCKDKQGNPFIRTTLPRQAFLIPYSRQWLHNTVDLLINSALKSRNKPRQPTFRILK